MNVYRVSVTERKSNIWNLLKLCIKLSQILFLILVRCHKLRFPREIRETRAKGKAAPLDQPSLLPINAKLATR